MEVFHVKQHVVSDHAVIRYMERVMGLDMDELRDKIDADGRLSAASRLKLNSVQIGNHMYMLKGGVCTTVLPAGEVPGQDKRKAPRRRKAKKHHRKRFN